MAEAVSQTALPDPATALQAGLFSYASPTDPLPKRCAIRIVEICTGQPKLKRLYAQYQRERQPEDNFWEKAVERLRLTIRYNFDALETVPREGPVVIVANHPYGVLDGIVVGYLAGQIRSNFKILTNSLLYRAPELRPNLLPIDFAETPEAMKINLNSRAEAIQVLQDGGLVVVFPGGGVSTSENRWGKGSAVDPEWKPFTAKLISRTRATVLPIYFQGQNSRLFQWASHVSQTLRLSLLMKEVADRIGSEVRFNIGRAIPYDALAHITDRAALTAHLRSVTYALGTSSGEPSSLAVWEHLER